MTWTPTPLSVDEIMKTMPILLLEHLLYLCIKLTCATRHAAASMSLISNCAAWRLGLFSIASCAYKRSTCQLSDAQIEQLLTSFDGHPASMTMTSALPPSPSMHPHVEAIHELSSPRKDTIISATSSTVPQGRRVKKETSVTGDWRTLRESPSSSTTTLRVALLLMRES